MTNYKKMFNRANTGRETSFTAFKEWAESRGIKRFIKLSPVWQNVTRKGVRGLRDPYEDQCHFPTWDHASLWGTVTGEKIIALHPNAYLPGDKESCFTPPNIHYVPGESEKSAQKKIDEFKSWAAARGLDIKLFSTKYSWYSPGSTILIEIRESTRPEADI